MQKAAEVGSRQDRSEANRRSLLVSRSATARGARAIAKQIATTFAGATLVDAKRAHALAVKIARVPLAEIARTYLRSAECALEPSAARGTPEARGDPVEVTRVRALPVEGTSCGG